MHGQVFFFHRFKCETRHTRSAAKWHSNDRGMLSLLEKKNNRQRKAEACRDCTTRCKVDSK